jgi:hypothetical protein
MLNILILKIMGFLRFLICIIDVPREDIMRLAHLKRKLKCVNRSLSFLGFSKSDRKALVRLKIRLRFIRYTHNEIAKFLEKVENLAIRFFEKHGVVKFLEKHWFFYEPNDGREMERVDQILSLFQPLNWQEVRKAARIAALLLFFVVPPVIHLIDWYIVVLW